MSTSTIAQRPAPAATRDTAPERPAPSRPVLTRAELAECTCPEHCERDHEWD
jgi:hypothetical protein